MNKNIVLLKYTLPFVTFIGACCQELSITLSIHPSHKVVSNSTVVLRCTVDRNILGHGDVEWYRRQGVNKYQLGRGSVRQLQLTNSTRYQLRTESQTASKAVYKLTITGVQVEDSATIECAAGKPSTRKASQVLAVCADTSSGICDCTLKSGWTSPDCIDTVVADDGFERAAVGLGVCLALTLLFAAVATAVVVYDCRHKLRAERLKEAEREASLAHSAAVISSQTAASSAMKPRSADSSATVISARPAVRFTDIPKTDISC